MENADKKFDVSIFSENKGKEKFTFTFDFKITSDSNCRIKIYSCQVYDLDGNMYQAKEDNISFSDIIIGVSKYFSDSKKVNATISKLYKSRIGCSLVLTIADLDEKRKMRLCYQKKSATRWDLVGEEPMEYEDIISDTDEKTAKAEEALVEIAVTDEVVSKNAKEVERISNEEIITETDERNVSEATDSKESEHELEKINNQFEKLTDTQGYDVDQEKKLEKVTDAQLEQSEIFETEIVEAIDDVEETQGIEEENLEMSGMDRYLNSILEYDIESASKIGLVLDNVSLVSVENGTNYVVSLSCMPRPSEERRLMVRCPMIKAFFYDEYGSMDNVAMARMSMVADIDELIEITLKKAPLKYWEKLSKIKIMATV